MQVQELECQIAQAQMGRYLSGEQMPTDMIDELEGHIANCDRCKKVLQERRTSLELLLSDSAPANEAEVPAKRTRKSTKAAVSVPDEEHVPAAFAGRPTQIVPEINLGGESRVETPTDFLKKNAKTLIYSVLLALVLVVMSFFLREPTKLFGDRVISNTEPAPAATAGEVRNKASAVNGAATTPNSTAPSIQNQPITDQALTAAGGSLESKPLENVESAPIEKADSGAVSEFALGAAMSVLSPSPRSPVIARTPRADLEKTATPHPSANRKVISARKSTKRWSAKVRLRPRSARFPAVRVYSPSGAPISPNR